MKSAFGKSASSFTAFHINSDSITAVVLARNEERNLPRALDSLPRGMRVLVIDHGSGDETPAIAAQRGARVIVRDFHGFVEGRRFALSHVGTPWTLMIDADEFLDRELADAILQSAGDANGYLLLRTTFYCGRALQMWRAEPLLRLFRTDRATLGSSPAGGGAAQLHERWTVEPPVETLPGTLLHYSYQTHAEYLAKFDRYTSIEAEGTAYSARRAVSELLRSIPRFFWYLVARGALRDGINGVRVAWWSALYPAIVQIKARHWTK